MSSFDACLSALLERRDGRFIPPLFGAMEAAVLGASAGEGTPHRRLLEQSNGGYFFGGALHLFGACAEPSWHSLAAWNSDGAWRACYGELARGLVFFAEDAFGDQFAYHGRGGEVVVFEAELGRVQAIAPSFLDWIDALIEQPDAVLPMEQVAAQPIQPGQQLYAFPPLFAAEVDDRRCGCVDALEAMRSRGQLALQLHGLAPGTQVQLSVEE